MPYKLSMVLGARTAGEADVLAVVAAAPLDLSSSVRTWEEWGGGVRVLQGSKYCI
jgi:hypothetical protein